MSAVTLIFFFYLLALDHTSPSLITMEGAHEVELQIHTRESHEPNSDDKVTNSAAPTKRGSYKWWFLVLLYCLLILVGQSGATLLGRFYFDNKGNSMWLATIVQSAGFPSLVPFLVYFYYLRPSPIMPSPSNDTNTKSPSFALLALIYLGFGIAAAGDNLMYSYGLLYLPVSTYSLICATQLAFNAVFSYFFNSLKLTPFILNSVVLLTTAATILGVHADSSTTSTIPKGKFIVGFLCTIGASALFSLILSLTQVFFEKVRKKELISIVFEMQFCVSMVATCVCIVGLFVSKEWRKLNGEMEMFTTGKVSYLMTLIWTTLLWQVYQVSCFSLIYTASSLFSNVVSAVCLPVVPICAVVLFHDKMDGLKVVAMFLALWGFLSYVYEHYLDYSKSRTTTSITAANPRLTS